MKTSLCFAVGDRFDFVQSAPFANYRSMIQRWNGSSWSMISSPNSPDGDNQLASVACVSASFCIAVGTVGANMHHGQVLIEQWNGTAWSIIRPPDITGSLRSLLKGVSCFSASRCFAVGQYASADAIHDLIEQWTGSSWQVVPSPHTGELNAVACPSSSLCFALGWDYHFNSGHMVDEIVAEKWDGSSWTAITFPQLGEIAGIGCAGASLCFAAGSMEVGDGSVSQPLMDQWDGSSWATVTTPRSSPTDSFYGRPVSNKLSRIGCASASMCFAAGNRSAGSGAEQLIQRWNGSSWEVAVLPKITDRLTPNHPLTDVACASMSTCFAVGWNNDYGDARTLIERWNGSKWSLSPSPNYHP